MWGPWGEQPLTFSELHLDLGLQLTIVQDRLETASNHPLLGTARGTERCFQEVVSIGLKMFPDSEGARC